MKNPLNHICEDNWTTAILIIGVLILSSYVITVTWNTEFWFVGGGLLFLAFLLLAREGK